jgi:hypothetical protein
MRRRPVLGAEDLADGVGIVGVGAEAVDGFRRKRDQLARAQRFDSLLDSSCSTRPIAMGNDNKARRAAPGRRVLATT